MDRDIYGDFVVHSVCNGLLQRLDQCLERPQFFKSVRLWDQYDDSVSIGSRRALYAPIQTVISAYLLLTDITRPLNKLHLPVTGA